METEPVEFHGDEEERKNYFEEEVKEQTNGDPSRVMFSEEISALTIEITIQIDSLDGSIDGIDPVQDDAQSEPLSAVSVDIADPAVNERLDRIEENQQKIFNEISRANREARNFNCARFFNNALGLAANLIQVAGIYQLYQIYSHPSGIAQRLSESTSPLSPETKAKLRTVVQTWVAQPDAAMWSTLQTASQRAEADNSKVPMSIGDHMLFMNYIVDGSRPDPFLWSNATDKLQIIDSLISCFSDSGRKVSAMYEAAPGLKAPNGTLLTRAAAADCIRCALAAQKFTA